MGGGQPGQQNPKSALQVATFPVRQPRDTPLPNQQRARRWGKEQAKPSRRRRRRRGKLRRRGEDASSPALLPFSLSLAHPPSFPEVPSPKSVRWWGGKASHSFRSGLHLFRRSLPSPEIRAGRCGCGSVLRAGCGRSRRRRKGRRRPACRPRHVSGEGRAPVAEPSRAEPGRSAGRRAEPDLGMGGGEGEGGFGPAGLGGGLNPPSVCVCVHKSHTLVQTYTHTLQNTPPCLGETGGGVSLGMGVGGGGMHTCLAIHASP